MNAKEVQRAVRLLFGNYDYKLFNSYMYAWECDFFAISKSKYAIEVEVKISRSDFFADFKKEDKHRFLINHKKPAISYYKMPFKPYMLFGAIYDPLTYPHTERDTSSIYFCNPADRLPNKFYYACPTGLILPDEIPKYAGLIYVDKMNARVIKPAPFLHKKPFDKTDVLLSKYYNRSINLSNMLFQLRYELGNHVTERGLEIIKAYEDKIHFDQPNNLNNDIR